MSGSCIVWLLCPGFCLFSQDFQVHPVWHPSLWLSDVPIWRAGICVCTFQLLQIMLLGTFVLGLLYDYVFQSLRCVPRSGITRSYCNSVFNLWQMHSTSQASCQHLSSAGAFQYSWFSECEALARGSIDVHFLDDCICCWSLCAFFGTYSFLSPVSSSMPQWAWSRE